MDQTRDDPGAHAHVGDAGGAGAEFRLLLETLAHRAEEFLHGLGADGDVTGARAWRDNGSAAATSRENCPMCAVLAVLRGERPELTSTVLEQLAALLAVVRRALDEHGRQAGHGATPEQDRPHSAPDDAREPDGESKVQRIDVRRVRGNVVRAATADPDDRVEGTDHC